MKIETMIENMSRTNDYKCEFNFKERIILSLREMSRKYPKSLVWLQFVLKQKIFNFKREEKFYNVKKK